MIAKEQEATVELRVANDQATMCLDGKMRFLAIFNYSGDVWHVDSLVTPATTPLKADNDFRMKLVP